MSEIILVDINGHTGSAPVTLRYSTQGYVTAFSRTNLCIYSEQFEQAPHGAWQCQPVATNVATAPNGTMTADKLIENATTNGHSFNYGMSVTAGVTYNRSVHLKAGERTWAVVGFASNNGAFPYTTVKVNLLTGAITTLVGTPINPVCVDAGGGWWRIGLSATASATTWGIFHFGAFNGSEVYLGDGVSGIYAWGEQIEIGTAMTDYIPTTSAAVTTPTSGTENLYYEGRVKQPGNMQRSVFDVATTFGKSKVGYGEVVLVNNDGALDAYLTYGFAGFPITIKRGVMLPNQSTPTWTTVITGTMDSVDFSWNEISIKVRDRQQELAKQLQASRYGGTNSLPNGLDGVATDIKGSGRPILFGRALNFSPPQVNTSRKIYEISDGTIQSVDAVYDRGTALTAGAAYTSQSDMETNAPAAGQYRVWISSGGTYIRLGSEPGGQLTVDASQGAAVANRTAAQLMQQVLLKGGISSGDITAADVTALDAACSYECGYWVTHGGDTFGTTVLDALANSVGAWWGVDRLGKFRMGQLAAPSSGNSIGTLTALDIITIDRVRSADQGGGVPAWQVTLNYGRMFTVLNDLSNSVPTTFKSDRSTEWRSTVANDASVKTQWPKAQELQFDTHLLSASDAAAEATRRLGLYKVRRDTLQARVKLSDPIAAAIDLGKTVVVQLPRFGMSAGKAFLVTGIRTDMRNNTFDLTLWG